MAITVLDVRDSVSVAPLRAHLRLVPAVEEPARRRLPVAVVVAALVAGVESVGLLAAALTGFNAALSSLHRPAGIVVAAGLVVLATWIVLCAGSGAALLEAAGDRLYRGVCYAELALITATVVVTLATPLFDGAAAPVLAIELLALAVPAGKLLLAGSPSATRWVAQGPRPVEQRPDPVTGHRVLCTVTMAVLALALTAVALVGAPADQGPGPVAATVSAGH